MQTSPKEPAPGSHGAGSAETAVSELSTMATPFLEILLTFNSSRALRATLSQRLIAECRPTAKRPCQRQFVCRFQARAGR